jgi:hypothetical protein
LWWCRPLTLPDSTSTGHVSLSSLVAQFLDGDAVDLLEKLAGDSFELRK